MTDRDEPRFLSPSDADRLLKRAGELDLVRSSAIPTAQLRQAAIDAGIDPAAFDEALLEFRGHSPTSVTPAKAAPKSIWAPMAALGASLSGLVMLAHPYARIEGIHVDRLGLTAAFLTAFAYLLLRYAPSSGQGGLQRDLGVLFATFIASCWLMNAAPSAGWPWAMMFSAGWTWLGTAIVGGGLIAFKRRSQGLEGGAGTCATPGAEADPLHAKTRSPSEAWPDSDRLEVRGRVEIVPA